MSRSIGTLVTSLRLVSPQAQQLQGWLESDHDASIVLLWSAACFESASFVVLPKSPRDITIVLKVITALRLTFSASTRHPGLVVDLRNLNQVAVADDKKIVSLGPGALWGEVYTALDPHEVSVIGGRIASMGARGLILGGIISVHNIWYELGIYQLEQNRCSDTRTTVGLIAGLDAVTLGLIYSEPSPQQPACFAPFKDIPATAHPILATNGTVLVLSQILGAAASATPPHSKINAQLYKDTFVPQPVTAAMVQYGLEKGGNCLGLAPENAQWWTTLIDWEHEKDDAAVREVSITTEGWKALGQEIGLHDSFLYMDDASRDQNPLLSYGEESLRRLEVVSLRYDPAQVFQDLQNNGFC
ncbi:hypothetical protein BDW59DRAFT_168318 [Aspergillus cavernicola]|uniref:FAD linked oxidase N-terminal domain-containing protein n=1 Tax=Aspergillus cavernicola TaxID=176166 RepID=A0ABR4J527_9EURO